jgi:hypothetical protein
MPKAIFCGASPYLFPCISLPESGRKTGDAFSMVVLPEPFGPITPKSHLGEDQTYRFRQHSQRPSAVLTKHQSIIHVILLCPTFGLMIFTLHIIQHPLF